MTSSFGENFDPLGEHLQDPYPFYARARKDAPVFWSPRMNAWVVTRFDDIGAVLRDTDSFSNANAIRTIDDPAPAVIQEVIKLGYAPAPTVIGSDGEQHRVFRGPWARNFAVDRVNTAEPVMRSRASAFVDAFQSDGRAEMMRQFASPLPVAVLVHMFGVESLDEQFVAAGTRGLLVLQGSMSTMLSEEEQVEAVRHYVDLVRHFVPVVAERRADARRGDLTSAVLDAMAPGDGPLTHEEEELVVQNLAGSLLPGHETTSAQIGNGIRHLLTHHEQWELLCERPELIPQAVEEICRYDTAVPGMFRLAKKDVEVGGAKLPAGSELFLAMISANRDEAFVERPDVFDINRAAAKHLTFGFGAHYCLGAETGRRELRVALETLTSRLPGLRLAPDAHVEVAPVFVTRRPAALPVVF